jgi:hypothetical protein
VHVTVKLDDAGLHAPDTTFAPGYFVVQFVDRRTNLAGRATLQVSVHPNLGVVATVSAGDTKTVLLCPHHWYLGGKINGTETYAASLDTSGTSPLCTTPVT